MLPSKPTNMPDSISSLNMLPSSSTDKLSPTAIIKVEVKGDLTARAKARLTAMAEASSKEEATALLKGSTPLSHKVKLQHTRANPNMAATRFRTEVMDVDTELNMDYKSLTFCALRKLIFCFNFKSKVRSYFKFQQKL